MRANQPEAGSRTDQVSQSHPAWYAVERAAGRKRPCIQLPEGSLIVGDLHLDVDQPSQLDRFEQFLQDLENCPRLLILGDLFEFWFGDGQVATPGGQRAVRALGALVDSGCKVDVVPGNRDFLLGPGFERASGARVRSDGVLAQLREGSTALFIHGDELCTLDGGYQLLRRMLRSAPVRWASKVVPGALAGRVARRLRRASRDALAAKPCAETELQERAAAHLAEALDVGALVCGHAHLFRDELLGAQGRRWLVVDDLGQGAGARPVRDALRVVGGELVPGNSGYPAAIAPEGFSAAPRDLSSSAAMAENTPLIIAIDGPAGAGKSTVARRVAGELRLPFLDTGAMYRAVTWQCLERSIDLMDGQACGRVADEIQLDFDAQGRVWVDGRPGEPEIRSRAVEAEVSRVSAHGQVREFVVEQQQRIGASGIGLVAEGRDTTTVVFPNATFKFFLWASPEARASRRALQIGESEATGKVLQEILARDAFDTGREIAPLRQAPDAIRIDADHMAADQVARAILDHVHDRIRPADTPSGEAP